MKTNIFSKLSNRTKIIAGGTILLATAAVVSAVVDGKEVNAIEQDFSAGETIGEAVTDAIEELAATAEEAVETLEI